MARIREFIQGDREVKPPRSEVDAYVQKLQDADGELLLYLYNYAARGPQFGASPTQSIHFDRVAAKAFKKILEDAFGPL